MADYSSYGEPSAEWLKFVNSGFLKPPPAELTLNERRDYLNESRAKLHDEIYGPFKGDIDIFNIDIPSPDGSPIQTRLYTLTCSPLNRKSPLIIHLHSGGWHLGNIKTEDAFCAYLCTLLAKKHASGYAVLHVNYRHTPEYHFPTQLDDVYTVFEYLADNAALARSMWGIDSTRIILSGTSAGAHLAVGCAILNVQRMKLSPETQEDKRIKGLVLTCPPTVHPDLFPYHLVRNKETSSHVQNANEPLLGIDRARLFWGLFLSASREEKKAAQSERITDVLISPLTSKVGVFDARLWPMTCFHVAGMDILRDEGLLFEDKLKSNGVKTRLHVYPGFPHAFNMLPQLEESKRWMVNLVEDILSIPSN